jgi:hypothetical protein
MRLDGIIAGAGHGAVIADIRLDRLTGAIE